MKKRKWKRYVFLIIVLVAGAVLYLRLRDGNGVEETITEVRPEYRTIETSVSTTGTVEPENRLEMKPSISGRIDEILVNEGQHVEKGSTLAWMSSTERAALLDAARSQGEESLKYWEEAYKPTPIIAPISGDVIVRAVEPGQTVTSSDVIIVLSDRLVVTAHVDETDIGSVTVGQEATISLDAYPEITAEGTVDHISYESEIVNNVTIYEVRIVPKEVPEVFRSGMSANVDIIMSRREDVLTIPSKAVIDQNGGKYVLVKTGTESGPELREVKLGESDLTNVEVLSGIGPNDTMVIRQVSNGQISGTSSESSSPFMPSPPGRKK